MANNRAFLVCKVCSKPPVTLLAKRMGGGWYINQEANAYLDSMLDFLEGHLDCFWKSGGDHNSLSIGTIFSVKYECADDPKEEITNEEWGLPKEIK